MNKRQYLAPLVDMQAVDATDVIATSGLEVSPTDAERDYGPLIPVQKK